MKNRNNEKEYVISSKINTYLNYCQIENNQVDRRNHCHLKIRSPISLISIKRSKPKKSYYKYCIECLSLYVKADIIIDVKNFYAVLFHSIGDPNIDIQKKKRRIPNSKIIFGLQPNKKEKRYELTNANLYFDKSPYLILVQLYRLCKNNYIPVFNKTLNSPVEKVISFEYEPKYI